VYGKITSITKTVNSIITTINYTYDAGGDRIGKTVNGKNTWYVRDASGNVMAIYENGNAEINASRLSQIEVDLYGSGRLGLWKANRDVQNWPTAPVTSMPGITNGAITVLYKAWRDRCVLCVKLKPDTTP
jgi:YD repeat-containing protein